MLSGMVSETVYLRLKDFN